MALFKRKKVDRRAHEWGWDHANVNLSGDQLWSLLANGLYFRAVAPRLDMLGGGLEGRDWSTGLADWWDVHSLNEFEALVQWLRNEGHRSEWAKRGVDDGDEKLAWDYCRLITVTGGAAMARMIDLERAWDIVLDAGDAIEGRFDSWAALSENYLSGRILWLDDLGKWDPDPDPSQQQFEGVSAMLLDDATSPWNRVAFDRSQGVQVDGELFE